MSWLLTNFIAAFLLPPLNLLVLFLAGLLMLHRRPKLARIFLGLAFCSLWLLSTPLIASSLLRALESSVPVVNFEAHSRDYAHSVNAIVVLGGSSYFNAPEYAGDTVGSASLERLRYAAKLHRQINKPILLTGGTPLGNSQSEAYQMKLVLEQEFHTPVRWTEDLSSNTQESARNSFTLLHAAGIKRIALVTHAWHMPRALLAFRAAGFEITPAPTIFSTNYDNNLLAFIPSADALYNSKIFFHELIGMVWYRLKY